MSSSVQKLIQAAATSSTPVTESLRYALVIAQRLEQHDIVEWATYELNGYPPRTAPVLLPFYRHLIVADNNTPHEKGFQLNLLQPIGLLEEATRSTTNQLIVKNPQTEENTEISAASLFSVLEMVRNILTEWGLILEKAGIAGNSEGLFSSDEKQKAHTLHFPLFEDDDDHGASPNLPAVTSGKYDKKSLDTLITALEKEATNPKLETRIKDELQAALLTLKTQNSLNQPQWPIIHAVHTTLSEIVNSGRQIIPYLSELFPL